MSGKQESKEQVTVSLSEALAELWSSLRDQPLEQELEQTMVLSLVAQHKISSSRGAELLGLAYRDFLDLMDEHGIPVLDHEKGETEADLERLDQILGSKSDPNRIKPVTVIKMLKVVFQQAGIGSSINILITVSVSAPNRPFLDPSCHQLGICNHM